MQLRAVIKNAYSKQFRPFGSGGCCLTTELAELSGRRLAKLRGLLGRDTVDADLINSFDENQIAPLQLFLAVNLNARFIDLVNLFKNPALGLAEVHEDYVQLVDRYGKLYRLNLKDQTPLEIGFEAGSPNFKELIA